MGIPVDGPAYILGDNQSVLANTTIPESTLKKKSQSIAYHFVREGSARDEWRTSYVNTHLNESDLLTKLMPNGEKRKNFVRSLLHHIYSVTVRQNKRQKLWSGLGGMWKTTYRVLIVSNWGPKWTRPRRLLHHSVILQSRGVFNTDDVRTLYVADNRAVSNPFSLE